MPYFIIGLLLAASAFALWRWLKERARARLLEMELTGHQRAVIGEQVPLILKLPTHLLGPLEGKINVFLNQVEFIGCNGLEVTEEMRLSIAAQACLLVVNSDNWYDHLLTILVYPGAFMSRERTHDGYVVTERELVRIGESWSRGPVILSWPHAEQGAINHRDGHNVVMHEFAHQIDDLSGHTDGTPLLDGGQSFADWERVFITAHERHARNVEKGRKTVLDAYGADGPAEFFAVAVETFFEKPAVLKRKEPEVYDQLAELFRLDPAGWASPPGEREAGG